MAPVLTSAQARLRKALNKTRLLARKSLPEMNLRRDYHLALAPDIDHQRLAKVVLPQLSCLADTAKRPATRCADLNQSILPLSSALAAPVQCLGPIGQARQGNGQAHLAAIEVRQMAV